MFFFWEVTYNTLCIVFKINIHCCQVLQIQNVTKMKNYIESFSIYIQQFNNKYIYIYIFFLAPWRFTQIMEVTSI